MISRPSPEVRCDDANGQFALAGLPTGRRSIRVSYEGRETQDYVFTLEGQRTKQIAVVLDVDASISTARRGSAASEHMARLAGFYERGGPIVASHSSRAKRSRGAPMRLSGLLTLGHRDPLLSGLSADAIQPRKLCRPGERRWVRSERWITIRSRVGRRRVESIAVPPADLSHSLVRPSVRRSGWHGLSAAGSCGLVEIWTR